MDSIPTGDQLLSVVSSAGGVGDPITNDCDISTAKDGMTISRIDSSYCYEDIVFQVENTLFKVHRAPFEQSSDVFRDMFQIPTPEGKELDGSSDEHPLRLEGMREGHFRALLKAMFPLHVEQHLISLREWTYVLKHSHLFCMEALQSLATSRIIGLPAAKDEWVFVLDFSMTTSNLQIPEIREAALEAISKLSLEPVDKVLLARQYKVKQWLIEGYNTLVRREQSISIDDEICLGTEVTNQLLRMRDRSNWKCTCYYSTSYSRRGNPQHTSLVRGPLSCQTDVEANISLRFAEEIEHIGNPDPQEQPHTDPPIHPHENAVSRDKVFYFTTEIVRAEDASFEIHTYYLRNYPGFLQNPPDARNAQNTSSDEPCWPEVSSRSEVEELSDLASEAQSESTSFNDHNRDVPVFSCFPDTKETFPEPEAFLRDIGKSESSSFDDPDSSCFIDAQETVPDQAGQPEESLRDIGKLDLQCLLKGIIFVVESRHDVDLTWTEWTSVLKVSDWWHMVKMRSIAVGKVSSLPAGFNEWTSALKDPTVSRIPEIRDNAKLHWENLEVGEVEKIQLAQECKSRDFMLQGYKRLVTRDRTLEEDEERLGKETTLDLFRLRDKYHLAQRGSFPYGPFELTTEIEKVFGVEMEWASSTDEFHMGSEPIDH